MSNILDDDGGLFVTKPFGTPVRKSDPHTAHQSAGDIRLKAGTQRHLMLIVFGMEYKLNNESNLTSEEAFRLGTQKYALKLSPFSYWKRISELNQMGLITYAGKDRVGESGKAQRAFCLTQSGMAEVFK